MEQVEHALKMEKEVDSEEESLWKPFLLTILLGASLSLLITALLVFLLLGVPALRATGFIQTNCTTQFIDIIGPKSCSYDCGNDLEQCERHFMCTRVHVFAADSRQPEMRSVLAWDTAVGNDGSVECSNFPECRYQGVLERYGHPGEQYTCYSDPSRPDVVAAQAPASPMPYVLPLAVGLSVMIVVVTILLCWRWKMCSKGRSCCRFYRRTETDCSRLTEL